MSGSTAGCRLIKNLANGEWDRERDLAWSEIATLSDAFLFMTLPAYSEQNRTLPGIGTSLLARLRGSREIMIGKTTDVTDRTLLDALNEKDFRGAAWCSTLLQNAEFAEKDRLRFLPDVGCVWTSRSLSAWNESGVKKRKDSRRSQLSLRSKNIAKKRSAFRRAKGIQT